MEQERKSADGFFAKGASPNASRRSRNAPASPWVVCGHPPAITGRAHGDSILGLLAVEIAQATNSQRGSYDN